MSSIRLLLAFSEAARRGSFARAARELGLSPSAVAKNVMRLEQHLKLRLFHRTTRRVSLTQEGEELYERCRRIVDELSELELAAADATRVPTGVLRIDVPITYGKRVVLPIAAELARRYPDLRLDVRLSDQFADVIGGGLDAVVRVGTVSDSRLVARVFDHQYLGVYASPAYFARTSRPREPAAVARHDCIVFRMPTSGRDRPWEFKAGGKPFVLHPRANYAVNDGEGMVSAAVAGLGLIQVPDYMANAAVASGQLQEVLVKFRPDPMPISLVFPTNRHVPLRVRVLIDALSRSARVAALRGRPAQPETSGDS